MFQLSTEIRVRRRPGKNDGNNYFKEAKVIKEKCFDKAGSKYSVLDQGGGATDVDTKGK